MIIVINRKYHYYLPWWDCYTLCLICIVLHSVIGVHCLGRVFFFLVGGGGGGGVGGALGASCCCHQAVCVCVCVL